MNNKIEITRCEEFIKNNFLQMPTVKSVMLYSLFFNEGTYTNEEIIKQALKNINPEELYKRN